MRRLSKFILALTVCMLMLPVRAFASSVTADMAQFPNVMVSPDGSNQGWTTDYGDKSTETRQIGYTIDMHVESSLRELNPGEHYYRKAVEGAVTVGKWEVRHSPGQCIHGEATENTFAGFTFGTSKCYGYYNNGWFAYCADCEQPVHNMLIYGRKTTMENITFVPGKSVYVYMCPLCDNLDQGVIYQHYCKGISANKYRVIYSQNAPADGTVLGYMAPTMHLYNNSDTYNGQSAVSLGYADRNLRKNSLTCVGYVFAGWNTKPDGSGTAFSDGQAVKNLTTEENGAVVLYAQWTKSESSLLVDAAGGTYNGYSVYERLQKHGTSYKVNTGLLKPPAGYTVSFVTGNGQSVSPVTTTKRFSHWEMQSGFQGEFKDDVYKFFGANGHKDRITAQYLNNSFTLPDCVTGDSSLVGWYSSSSLTDDTFVGKPGDTVTVDKVTTLYAKWAQLTLWAYDDYTSHGGTGAVDLKWQQKDGKSKYYRLYQSGDKASWKEIYAADDIRQNAVSVSESYNIGDKGKIYTIPYTGNYTVTVNGASGADYSSTLKGGKGGRVTATYWLTKGDILTVYPGSAGSGQTGGTNGIGAAGGSSGSSLGRGGGAASMVYLTRNGTKSLLLIAGGGGGANGYASGGAGGTGGGNGTVSNGAAGVGGGGGGRTGGKSGDLKCHHHTGSATSGGGCYLVFTQGHKHNDSCYTNYIQHTGDSGIWYDSCGCRHQIHYWQCTLCWQSSSSQTNSSEECREGHTVTDDGAPLACHEWVFTCDRQESNGGYSLGCGYSEGDIESAGMSYGGTNYILESYGIKNQTSQSGMNTGNGTVTVNSVDIGYLESNELKDVPAKDMAAPNRITGYSEAKNGENVYRITIIKPDDNGTIYYHKAESFAPGSTQKIATSNITENTLISGVTGYRYYVDSYSTGNVTLSHSFTDKDGIDISLKSAVQYLHVAAVDVAGNVGPSVSIQIPAKADTGGTDITPEYIQQIPPATDMLDIMDTDAVHAAGSGRYFVKADGTTEHILLVKGYLNGSATNKYQVDALHLVLSTSAYEEWYQVNVPKVDVGAGDRNFTNTELTTGGSVQELRLLTMSSVEAARTNQSRNVKVEQRFMIGSELDGKEITVYPRALAEYDGTEYISDITADQSHALVLVPDGKAPVINGMEALENAGNIDMTEAQKEFIITAYDNGSGLRNLSVTVTNLDNYMTKTYTSDTGSLTIIMEKDDYLFLGDFIVSAEAVDNVGNREEQGSDTLAFSLKAELERSRYPHNGDFKAGDGAVLTVTTGGYADKVIIRFLEELLALNPDLNREYIYEFPEAIRTEVYEFNIPLDTPDGSYVIEVEAWKNGRKLTEAIDLNVVKAGSITDEFRTRIRDNGI